MKKHQLKKSDIRQLNEQLNNLYGLEDFFDKKDTVEVADKSLVLYEDKPLFFYRDDKPVPTLHLCLKNSPLKQVTVDMGAVKFVTGGADIMRPGISEADNSIQADEPIVIVDQANKKPLAVGKALYSGEEIMQMENGKVIENLHYVGDEIWDTQ